MGVMGVLIGAIHCCKSVFVCVYVCEKEETEKEGEVSHTFDRWVTRRMLNDAMRWQYLCNRDK